MKAEDQDLWSDAIREHDRKVLLSLLALGLAPDRAHEISQATWTRLMEKHSEGALAELQLPGLAIRQARFLAINALNRERTEHRALRAVPDPPAEPDVERVVMSRQQLARALDALAGCSPMARKVFRLVYIEPDLSHADVARSVGLSIQRVRQILCETRKQIKQAIDGVK